MELQTIGSKVLRRVATRVAKVDDTIRCLAFSMSKVMNEQRGVGIAAPQVGISKRIIIIDDNGNEVVMVNPEIVWMSSEVSLSEEGCLSCPNTFGQVLRSNQVKVKFRNLKGKPCVEVYNDLSARIVQHEIDHLNGILFVDHLCDTSETVHQG